MVRAACCPVSVARLWRSEAVVDKAEVVLVGSDKEEADVQAFAKSLEEAVARSKGKGIKGLISSLRTFLEREAEGAGQPKAPPPALLRNARRRTGQS